MNYSFHTGTFVRAWKIAEVTPILKSGNSEDPCNNRPISPLAILSKVSERLAHGQFVDYFTANKILAKTQTENPNLYFTETAVLCATDELLQAIDDKKISALVLLNMSKAFDSIRHDILLQKLQALGLSFSCRYWFHSYLVGRSQRVRIRDAVSLMLFFDLKKIDHISQAIKSLNWLPVNHRIYLNDAVMMYKCINKLVRIKTWLGTV